MVASVPEEMTCDVHDRGRERYLHGTRPPTQRVLRRRLLRDPDANGRRTLRVGETAAPDLPEHAPELRLTFGDPAALWQTTASQRLVRRDRAVAPSGHADVPDESGAGGGRAIRALPQLPADSPPLDLVIDALAFLVTDGQEAAMPVLKRAA